MALDAMTLQVTGEKNNPFVCTEKVVNLLLQLMTNGRENKSVAIIFLLNEDLSDLSLEIFSVRA